MILDDRPNLISVGQAASMLQALPNSIREIANGLGIRPVITLNTVPYYSEADLDRIAAGIRNEALADIVAQRASSLQ